MRSFIYLTSGLLLLGFAAQADVFTFDLDHCSGGCGTDLGTVTVTQDGANTVMIDVASTGSGFDFVNSAGIGDQFFFNIGLVSGGNVDNPTISVSKLTSGWTLASTTAGSYGGAGWSFEYALTCLDGSVCKHGASDPKSPPLTFDVTAAGLTPASFEDSNGNSLDGTPVDFAADVIGISSGNTGLIGAGLTSPTPSVPEPSSILLLATFVGIIGITLRRRRSA